MKFAKKGAGVALLVAAITLLLSLLSYNLSSNWLGLVGTIVGGVVQYSVGLGGYLLLFLVGWHGWSLLRKKESGPLWSATLLLISCCFLLAVGADSFPQAGLLLRHFIYTDSVTHLSPIAFKEARFHLGGVLFTYLYEGIPGINLRHLLSPIGTSLVFATLAVGAAIYHFQLRPLSWARKLASLRTKRKAKLVADPFVELEEIEPMVEELIEEQPRKIPKKQKKLPVPQLKLQPYQGDFQSYKLPRLDLVTAVKQIDQSQLLAGLKSHAKVLEETLASFGIEAKAGEINCGPTITSFEVHPAVGVKVQKIKALANDIALNMKAKSIRIIAPIPGKAAVGVEMPNPKPQEVGLREIIADYVRNPGSQRIPIFLGKAVNGDNVIADMTRMPHLIIAGATGSGKSVCLNSIIMSILMTKRPDEVKLLMVDPKKVELTLYSPLPHMIAPVITEPREACTALNWLVKEMEKRYELLKLLGVRNIEAFNNRKRNVDVEEALDVEVPERMSYIVAIIDELADLMMVSASDIETPVTRIAQMARAVGIHLILATQRPSREVITGLIKANFPARIAFKVSSRVNSSIILDEPGAENLLGLGDMLFLPPGTAHLLRAQGAYVRDEDINQVVNYVCSQASTDYLIQSFGGSIKVLDDEDDDVDELYNQAYETILQTGLASTTFLQRKLKIGYARAASIMDQLEERKVVGPAEGAKPRQILVRK